MRLTPWFQIGKSGPPVRSGVYEFEVWINSEITLQMYGVFVCGSNYIITDDGRFIGLTYEDYWRGVLK
jgi:hypothetical protein